MLFSLLVIIHFNCGEVFRLCQQQTAGDSDEWTENEWLGRDGMELISINYSSDFFGDLVM